MTRTTTRLTRRTTLTAGVGALLVLGGCGSQRADSGAGASATSATGAPASTSGGSDSAATRFADRATSVADKLRAAGVPAAYGKGLVLLDNRVTWPGFTDDLAKQAALAGRAVLALPRVSVPPTVTVGLPDGSSLTLDLQSPGAAAAEAITQPCGPTERCGLSLDHASLTSRTLLTNHGRVKLPVWKFTGGGLDGALYVVAVPPTALTSVASPDLGLPADTHLAAAQNLGAVTDDSLAFVIGTGSCDRDVVARVVESDDLVVVGGTVTPPTGACDAALRLSTVSVPLRAPLGSRPVVDVVSGAILHPAPVPTS